MTQPSETPGQRSANHDSAASHDPVQVLTDRFRAAILAAYPQTARPDGTGPDPVIAVAKQQEFGDFQCNAAMALAKKVGENPRKVASAIVARVAPMVADIAEPLTEASIAGPGFINIRLRSDALGGLLASMDTPALGVALAAQPERIVVDLCGVNLAKAMHVGHLRSTVIPDAIARTLTRLGHTVLRQSHLGDWGVNIAMVTGRIMRERAAGRLDLASVKLRDLEKIYKAAQAECERDMAGLEAVRKYGLGPKAEAELEEQVAGATEAFTAARKTLVDLQSREPETYAVWKRIYDVTMAACLETCRRLHADVTDEYTAGESTYADELGPLVEDLLARGIAEASDGAVVVRVEGVEVPCLIRKRDGGFLYATTDLAAIRRRVQKLGASRVIYGVDARQSLHFQQVFGAAKKAGYATVHAGPLAGNLARLEHAAFGTILGQDGRPFKTRSGESVSLTDLLDESVDRAKIAVAEREKKRERELPEAELARIAEVVGIAAIKYADLSNNRALDYVFDFDRMLASEGNTGPYLLYALVRVQSIFRTAEERGLMPAGGQAGLAKAALAIRAPAEKALALQLLRYPGVLQQVSETLEPHRLCQYLYDLASAYSAFYDQCPVLAAENAEDRASRLRLCDLVGRVLADGLGVLGIPVLQRM
jgi:arginyl-tRNA synthetase